MNVDRRPSHQDGNGSEMAFDELTVAGAAFRLLRRRGSAFVGLLRMDRNPAGELFGYVARLNTGRPEFRYFPRYAGWNGHPTALRTLVDAAVNFHARCAAREAGTR